MSTTNNLPVNIYKQFLQIFQRYLDIMDYNITLFHPTSVILNSAYFPLAFIEY